VTTIPKNSLMRGTLYVLLAYPGRDKRGPVEADGALPDRRLSRCRGRWNVRMGRLKGTLYDGRSLGLVDFLIRVEEPSELGA
jgi:hypothetical protein